MKLLEISARQIREFGGYSHQDFYLNYNEIVSYGLNMRGSG